MIMVVGVLPFELKRHAFLPTQTLYHESKGLSIGKMINHYMFLIEIAVLPVNISVLIAKTIGRIESSPKT